MRGRSRWLISALGVAAITVPLISASSAGATVHGPSAVTVKITGGDHFLRPNSFSNDFRFPNITIRQGGTITWVNATSEGHTMALVRLADVPKTTAQVDNCPVCDEINGAFFGQGNGPPAGAQIDNGVVGNVPGDAPDTGAIATVQPGALPPQAQFPILIDKFNVPTRGTVIGDATIVDTSAPPSPNGNGGNGGPTQRTVQMTAGPGFYHYICTLHPWMQGTIEVEG